MTPAPVKQTVSLEDVLKIDVRVGTIRAVEDVPRSSKLVVVNLEPKRMAGELSEGMLFDLGYADGVTPVLAVPESPVPNGTRAG